MACVSNMHGISMEYPWNNHGMIHGITMDGISMESLWNIHGLSLGPRYRARAKTYPKGIAHPHVLARAALATLQLVGMCIEYAKYTCGIRMEYVWNMCGTCMDGICME